MQNRTDGYHQGIAPDTLPGRVYFERTVTKSINTILFCAISATGKGMPANERKLSETAGLSNILY
jgi:hypothetical protein